MGQYQTNIKTVNIFTMSVITLTLLAILPAVVVGMQNPTDPACDSLACESCVASCDGCDQCGLCFLCFGARVGPCSQCKYCNKGATFCKKSCVAGKKTKVCKKCIAKCT